MSNMKGKNWEEEDYFVPYPSLTKMSTLQHSDLGGTFYFLADLCCDSVSLFLKVK